jgi:hypothetical protein
MKEINPRQALKTKRDWAEFARWVKAKAAAFEASEEIGPAQGTPKQKEMLAYWKKHRPRMYRAMAKRRLLPDLAFVLENLAFQEERRNLAGGMGWPDSREQAEQAWLLMEPEGEEESAVSP